MTNKIDFISKKSQHSEIFIHCVSYEDRTIASFKNFNKEYKPNKVIQFVMKEFEELDEVKKNMEVIDDILDSMNIQKVPFKCCWKDPILQINKLSKQFLPIVDTEYLTIDITTFPRNVILSILEIIQSIKLEGVRIIYWSPKIYGAEIGEWLTRGINIIEPLPMFVGMPTSGKEKTLVIFLGFENERAFKIWEEYEPAKTILVIGHPPTEGHWENVSYYINQKVISQNNAEIVCASAKNHLSVLKFLENIYFTLDLEKQDLVIATLGTKIQLIGVFLFKMKHADVQLAYAYPNEYNIKNYSKGWRKKYEFTL